MTTTLSPHDTDAEYRTLNLSHFLRPDRLRRPDATGEQPVYQPDPVAETEFEPTVYRSEPQGRPDRYRSHHRMPPPLWATAAVQLGLGMIGGAVAGGALLALAVLQAGGAW